MKVPIAKTSRKFLMFLAIWPLLFIGLFVWLLVKFSMWEGAYECVFVSLAIVALLAWSIACFVMCFVKPKEVLVFDNETRTLEYHINKKNVLYIAVYDIDSVRARKGRFDLGSSMPGFLVIDTKLQGRINITFVAEVDNVVNEIDRIRFGGV